MEEADVVIVIKATKEKLKWGYEGEIMETLKGEFLDYEYSDMNINDYYVENEAFAGKDMLHIRFLKADTENKTYYGDWGSPRSTHEEGSPEMQRVRELAKLITSGDRSTYNLSVLKWHLENWHHKILVRDAKVELEDHWTLSTPDLTSIDQWYYSHDDAVDMATHFTWDIADAEARELAKEVFKSHNQYSYPLSVAVLDYGMQPLTVCSRLLELKYETMLSHSALVGEDGQNAITEFMFGTSDDYGWLQRSRMPYITNRSIDALLQEQLPANCLERSFFERLLLFEIKMASLSTQTRLGLNHLADISRLSESVGEAELTAGHYQLANLVEMAVGSLDANDWAPGAYDKLPKIDGLHAFDEFISVSQQYVDMCSDPRIRILTGKRMLWDCSDESAFAEAETFEEGAIEVTTYPNPSNGQFTVRATVLRDQSITLRIFSQAGQETLSLEMPKLSNQDKAVYAAEVDLSSKPAGVYLVTLTQGNKVYQDRVSVHK